MESELFTWMLNINVRKERITGRYRDYANVDPNMNLYFYY